MNATTAAPTKRLYGRPTKKQKTMNVNAGKQNQEPLQYPFSTHEKTQNASKVPTEKIGNQKPKKLYKNVLTFWETGEISICKNRNYQVSVYSSLNSSKIRPVVGAFDTGAGSNFI